LDLKGRKTDHEENYIMTKFISLYYSPSIVRMIKSRRMRWAGHVARVGFWLGGPKGRDHWKDLGIGGKIILR
jgi:hypothetical protein